MAICRRYAVNDEQVSDVLNDGFMKVYTNISKYDSSRPFKTWLSKIITNTAIDHYRANLKFSLHEDLSDHEDIGEHATIYGDMAYKELLALVQELSPSYRLVFNLYAIDGYSHEEIAALLKISVGTSKSNLFKARQKLQERLNNYPIRDKSDAADLKMKYGS
jgi:RNA polymerase sigma factor (sigma-70 family)